MTRKEARFILKLKAETIVWCLKNPVIALIYFSPRTKVVDNFIMNHFSESTIEKCFDCPISYIGKQKLKTFTLLKALITG